MANTKMTIRAAVGAGIFSVSSPTGLINLPLFMVSASFVVLFICYAYLTGTCVKTNSRNIL